MTIQIVRHRDLVKVWPLVSGIPGLTAHGEPAILKAGVRGWMHQDKVAAAEAAGQVQKMVGLDVRNLKAVDSDAGAKEEVPRKRRRRTYVRRDIVADQEPVPFINGPPQAVDGAS